MGSAEQHLRSIGVGNFTPGFMDDPAFLAAEKINPLILEKYAAYIEEQSFDEKYLSMARARVRQLAGYLYPLLVKQGRLGACVDASGAIARMLERDGIWCYVVKGGLSIYPEAWTGVAAAHYAPISNQTVTQAPHAWVVVPPFRILDLTINLQPGNNKKLRRLIPDYVLSEDAERVKSSPTDWIDPPVWGSVARDIGHQPTMTDIQRLVGHDLDIANEFGTWEVNGRRAKYRYLTVAFGGFKEQLEGIKKMRFGGDPAFETYYKFCMHYKRPS